MSKFSIVSQTNIGIYVWRMPDGRFVADQDGNYMNIQAMRGDKHKMQLLTDAARHHGIEEGEPYFLEGSRRVTDEEYEEQRERMRSGLIPDPYDIGVYKDMIEDEQRRRG